MGTNKEYKSFSDLLTFTRASTGTYWGSQGALQTAAVDTPRLTHDPLAGEALGLLIEEQRTNLLLWSEDFTVGATWGIAALSDITVGDVSPIQGVNYYKIAESLTNAEHRIEQHFSATSGVEYSFSCLVRPSSNRSAQIRVPAPGFGSDASISIAKDGTQFIDGGWSSTSVTELGNGDYLLTGTRLASSTVSDGRYRIHVAKNTNQTTTGRYYAGDGSSFIQAIGAMAEVGYTPSSYIKTEGSQVTRSADTCKRTLGIEYNATSGTLTATAEAPIGSIIAKIGTLEIISDTNAEKTYTATYTSDPVATDLELLPGGSGTIKSVTYNPEV